VTTPAHALATLGRSLPNVIVFDFGDPGSADLQLLQHVKRLYPSVPILMLTEAHSEELAIWAFRARVWNYLVKPVPLRELKSNMLQLADLAGRREPGARRLERPAALVPAPRARTGRGGDNQLARDIAQKIQREFTSPLQVSALAQSLGMSRFRFARFFKKNFGCGCNEYIVRLRIRTACRLLRAQGMSVTDAAIASGFSDASYFARQFRAHMKQSPLEYATQMSRATDRKLRTLRPDNGAPAGEVRVPAPDTPPEVSADA
jgi:AraC-like DNA-binding protein